MQQFLAEWENDLEEEEGSQAGEAIDLGVSDESSPDNSSTSTELEGPSPRPSYSMTWRAIRRALDGLSPEQQNRCNRKVQCKLYRKRFPAMQIIGVILQWRNLYRERFRAILRIEEPSTRAAVMGRAVVHVKSKPSLLFMLLTQNSDILSCLRDSDAR
jgi:hypothetical protein